MVIREDRLSHAIPLRVLRASTFNPSRKNHENFHQTATLPTKSPLFLRKAFSPRPNCNRSCILIEAVGRWKGTGHSERDILPPKRRKSTAPHQRPRGPSCPPHPPPNPSTTTPSPTTRTSTDGVAGLRDSPPSGKPVQYGEEFRKKILAQMAHPLATKSCELSGLGCWCFQRFRLSPE